MQYTKPKRNSKEASDMMWDAGVGGGGPSVFCSCGKDHDISEEEYEADNYQGFEYVEMDGQQFVYGCDGCNEKLAKYENFIWQNRDHIRRYLKIRIDQEKAWADQEHLMNILADIK